MTDRQESRKEPKTRKEKKKDQSIKAKGVNGKYTSKHIRATAENNNGNKNKKGNKNGNRNSSKHLSKSARVGEINHNIFLDE